jgi:Ca-activated chloride channel family protein
MTRTLQESSSGFALRSENPADRIALRGVSLRARLAGLSQHVTIDQTFVNLEQRAIEAVYTFPLPENAAVCGFEVLTADRVLTGTIEEAEAATEKYEEAVSSGHGAFVMEQDRPDVFTVRVGNLKPRQAATIRLTYVCPLVRVDRQIRIAFPTTIAPRYATMTATDPLDAAMDADALNPPHVLRVPYGLSLSVEVDLGREMTQISSPSHAIQTALDDSGKTLVRFAGGLSGMNRDVVLLLKMGKDQEPQVAVEAGPDGATYLAVTFIPEFFDADIADPRATETVFVLDCSGSMMGDSIAQAKAALELCLRSLNAGDTFNICRFGSTFELMASEPLPYTEQTLRRALQYVQQSRDLGGTELHAPLEKVLTTPTVGAESRAALSTYSSKSNADSARDIRDSGEYARSAARLSAPTVRQIILLTDGQVTNEPAVVDLCRKHRAANRIFSFGIGAACSAFLVNGVARATGGAAEFITAGERIDEKVLRTFARLASPMISDIRIDWDGAEAQTLAEIPPIFDGDLLTIFARCPGRLPGKVTLSCRADETPRSWSVLVSAPAAAAAAGSPIERAGLIPTMWARRTIQSLEEVNGVSVRARKRKLSREQEQLIQISKQFNILCSLTTFIAIEHRSEAERNEGQPELRRVPVQIAKDWGGIEQFRGGFAGGVAYACAAPMAAPTGMPRRRSLLGKLFGGGGGGRTNYSGKAQNRSHPRPNAPPPVQAPAMGGAAAPPPRDQVNLDADFANDELLDTTSSAGDTDVDAILDEIGPTDADTSSTVAKMGPRAPQTVQEILQLQEFSGEFGNAMSLLNELVIDRGTTHWVPTIEAQLPATTAIETRNAVIRTVMVLMILRTAFAGDDVIWHRAALKAIRFLSNAMHTPVADVKEWLDELQAKLVP